MASEPVGVPTEGQIAYTRMLLRQFYLYGKVSMEEIVAPWEVTTTHVVREPKGPEEEFPEAFIEWGGPSDLAEESFRDKANNPGGTVNFIKPDEPERERITMSEEGRQWTDFRLNSPEDAEVYVIDRRTFGYMGLPGPYPDGSQWLFNFHASTPGAIKKGDGQEPPSPPLLMEIV